MKKFLASFLLAMTSVIAYGQAISVNGGSIQGTVTDASGAAVPGATVVIANPEVGYNRSLKTDAAGFYEVGPLNPGPYTAPSSRISRSAMTAPGRSAATTSAMATA